MSDGVEISGVLVTYRIEKTLVGRVRIRAADELDGDEIMRRHHASVVWMKLVAESLRLEPLADGIDAMGDDERGPLDLLGEKVPERTIERPCQLHFFAIFCDECKRPIKVADRFRGAAKHALPCLIGRNVEKFSFTGVGQIDDAFDVFVHFQERLKTLRRPNCLIFFLSLPWLTVPAMNSLSPAALNRALVQRMPQSRE